MARAIGTATRVGPTARDAIFAQLADTGRAEQVSRRLADAIVLGVLGEGERLPSEPELARRFGVAVITVREGLGMLREAGLVETRRGRDGGSFVTTHQGAWHQLDARLRAASRVELSDVAVYFATILGGCAARAAVRATDGEAERLCDWISRAPFDEPSTARVSLGGFYLEMAVLSQSPLLVREQIRMQAAHGPLLLLALADDHARRVAAAEAAATAAAVRAHDGDAARALVHRQVEALGASLLAAKETADRRDRQGVPA